MRSRKAASFTVFLHLVDMESLLVSTFLSDVLQGAKTLPRAKFGLNSVLFFAQ